MVFLNPIFQNPTGRLMSVERRRQIIEISTQYGIPIVEDDPYSILGYDQTPQSTLKSMDKDGAANRGVGPACGGIGANSGLWDR